MGGRMAGAAAAKWAGTAAEGLLVSADRSRAWPRSTCLIVHAARSPRYCPARHQPDAQPLARVDALLLQVADDPGRHAGVDRGLDRGGVALIVEHCDRPLHRAAHLEHLLQLVAARVLQVAQNDVGIERIDAREQARAV